MGARARDRKAADRRNDSFVAPRGGLTFILFSCRRFVFSIIVGQILYELTFPSTEYDYHF